jgi:hypothetical protein
MHQPHKVQLAFYYPRKYFVGLYHLHRGVKSVTECESRQGTHGIFKLLTAKAFYTDKYCSFFNPVTCHSISSAIRSHRQAVFFHVDDKDAVKLQALKRIIVSER